MVPPFYYFKDMNKPLLSLLLFFLALNFKVSHAQSQLIIQDGSLETFYHQPTSIINIEWDSDIWFYGGMTLNQFLKSNDEEYWNTTILPTIRKAFQDELNKYTSHCGIFFESGNDNATHTMRVNVNNLKRKGSCMLDYIITNNKSKDTVLCVNQIARGGNVGPIEELLTESFIRAGRKLGKAMSQYMLQPKSIKVKMRGERIINYRFDFSNLNPKCIGAKEYFYGDVEESDTLVLPKKVRMMIEEIFISAANKKSLIGKKYELKNKEKSRFEVVIFLEDIDEDGEHSLTARVVEKETGEIVSRFGCKVGSGKLNSFKQLFYEQLEESGEEFGDILADKVFN